jgi:hypothetical protein
MSSEGVLWLSLVTAHLLADFVLLSDKDAENKQPPAVLWRRALMVAGLSYLLAGAWRWWMLPVVIGGTHFLIDRIKIALNRKGIGWFAAGQAVHLLVIIGVARWLTACGPVTSEWVNLWGTAFLKGMVVISGLIVTTHVGGVVVEILVQPHLEDMKKPKPAGNGQTPATLPEQDRGLVKGGRSIGRWERGLIFFLAMIGKPEAVAFLVAAKSIFRFGELTNRQNRAEAEYITIGTLMSFTWGLVMAWITWQVFGQL